MHFALRCPPVRFDRGTGAEEQIASPTTFDAAANASQPAGVDPPAISQSTQILALGCKHGYRQSKVVAFTYAFQPRADAGGDSGP